MSLATTRSLTEMLTVRCGLRDAGARYETENTPFLLKRGVCFRVTRARMNRLGNPDSNQNLLPRGFAAFCDHFQCHRLR